MKTIARDFAPLILLMAFACGGALAQESSPDKHVKDLRAEQTHDVIFATPLCQRINAVRHLITVRPAIDPETLASDLPVLMRKSDEVILASVYRDEFQAVSPSGEQMVTYYDVTVLRTWKGSHKVGELLTFAIPRGFVTCLMDPPQHGPDDSAALTLTGGSDWASIPASGPYVLFLRQSQGDEKKVMPGLRLTAGDGMQGLFVLRGTYDYHDKYDRKRYNQCLSYFPGGPAKCIAALEESQETVKFTSRVDPLKAKYEGMPVPNFLQEVQSIANSLGYDGKNTSYAVKK
jgi:hypothetical protein